MPGFRPSLQRPEESLAVADMAQEPLPVTEVAQLDVLDLKGAFKERSIPVDDQQVCNVVPNS